MRCSRPKPFRLTFPKTRRRFFEACLPIEETRPTRPRHAALRADEAGGPDGSAHRPAALRGRAAPSGEPARGQLQPGRLSEPHAFRRAGARIPHDPRTRTRRVPALRPDSPQHVHQRAVAARRRRCSCARVRKSFSPARFRASKDMSSPSRRAWWPAGTQRSWRQANRCVPSRARPLSVRSAPTSPAPTRELPTGQYHVRSAARRSTRRPAQPLASRQASAPRRSLPSSLGKTGRIPIRLCLTSGRPDRAIPGRTAAPERLAAHAAQLRLGPGAVSLVLHARRSARALLWKRSTRSRSANGWAISIEQRLTAVSMRRKLAAVRSFFKFLLREGVSRPTSRGLVRTPKAPKSLPRRDDRRANQHAGGRHIGNCRQTRNARFPRAISRSSNCCTAAACASASWWA